MLKRLVALYFLLMVFIPKVFSQDNIKHDQGKPEYLIFEGGGMKGLAYAGALSVLEEKGMLKNLKGVGGTSAGAITALMLSIGYTSKEISAIIDSTSFGEFNDGKNYFIGGTKRLIKQYGWYKGDKFISWLEKIIEKKTGNKNITFKELHDKSFIDLKITGTCLNRQKLMVFSYQTYPQMPVKNAIRISTCIPYYFEAVFVDSLGAIYEKNVDSLNLDVMVDGGVLANYPIFLFDTYEKQWFEKGRKANPNTLGFMIEPEEQMQNDRNSHEPAKWPIEDIRDFSGAMYNVLVTNMSRNVMTVEDWQRTVVISSKGISPKVRELSADEKRKLIESGRESVEHFLRQE